MLFVVSLLPAVMAATIRLNQVFTGRQDIEGLTVFTNIIMVVYLQFLILILSLFFGTSVCSEEIEGKTLSYLVTRPIPKSGVILGKYAAYTLLILFMVNAGVVLSFVILHAGPAPELSLYRIMIRDMGVLSLGVLCYTALFTLVGTFLKKSILFGLIFSFGWENVVQYFPGSTQRFAIMHYLKSLLPPQAGGKFSILVFRLEPTPKGAAVIALVLMIAVFLSLACLVFSRKEYLFED